MRRLRRISRGTRATNWHRSRKWCRLRNRHDFRIQLRELRWVHLRHIPSRLLNVAGRYCRRTGWATVHADDLPPSQGRCIIVPLIKTILRGSGRLRRRPAIIPIRVDLSRKTSIGKAGSIAGWICGQVLERVGGTAGRRALAELDPWSHVPILLPWQKPIGHS